MAKLGVLLICECSLYAGVQGTSYFASMSWFSLKMLQVHSLKSVLIFSILVPLKFHCYLLGVSLLLVFDYYLLLKGNFLCG